MPKTITKRAQKVAKKQKSAPVMVKSVEKRSLLPRRIRKRNGDVVAFERGRITVAITKAMKASGEYQASAPEAVTRLVLQELAELYAQDRHFLPTVEGTQDLVERALMLKNYTQTAKAYILYRERRSEIRRQKGEVPEAVKALVTESKQYFRSQLSEFVYYTTYSRWIPEAGRREAWVETVDRYIDFMRENVGDKLRDKEYAEVREYMLTMGAMGSMRLLWSAGKAARNTNVAAYNCSFTAPQTWQDLGEIMYILMCGTGVGFSVEHQNVELFPLIERQTGEKLPTHVIADSKEGWADAFVRGCELWAAGKDIDFDYSQIRPQGARLSTMGGRASGPEPLRKLIEFARTKILARQGRRLSTVDMHDIICMIGEVVVMGGVRRSALISLSDLDDQGMREAKNGQFYLTNPQRSMANNSAVYNERPTVPELLDEWVNLIKSGSGERGIFNRGSLKRQLPARRWKHFQKGFWKCGTNPCGEIVLRSKQFCNLSEVIARPEDTEDTLLEKVRVATILGTFQASLTNFPYLSAEWKQNCEEEALLGVSITGQWDCPALRNPITLRKMKEVAIETNRKYASRLGINPSTCITCVKPSGNGSQLFDSSSGMHPRHAPYYIRRIRIERHNPLFMMLKDIGVPHHPEVGQDPANPTTYVLEFPVKAPESEVYKDKLSSLEQLEYWKMVKEHYTEHNPSTTISVGEHEWLQVANWVHSNWDIVGGLSFLPRSDHVYRLAPYETITKERYEELMQHFPSIDFSKLVLYEYDDETKGSKELACVAGTCEIDILPEPEKNVS